MERRKTNIARSRERRGESNQEHRGTHDTRPAGSSELSGNGEKLKPPGAAGAQFALRRLEQEESESYSRLQHALAGGNPVQIQACQDFWLKCSEVLRRLDLSVELARRDSEEMVTKKLACDVALYISDWLRIAFAVWLSSESRMLMGFREVGPFKSHAFESFKAILHRTVCDSLRTRSPVPPWAAEKVRESWNIPILDADGN